MSKRKVPAPVQAAPQALLGDIRLLIEAARQRAASAVNSELSAYFSPSWTAFQAERGRDFSVIVDGISN